MLDVDTDPEEVRKKTRKAIGLLTKPEFQGLIMLVLGDHDLRTTSIWDKVEPVFMEDDVFPHPIPHPDAFVEMGAIAKERSMKGE